MMCPGVARAKPGTSKVRSPTVTVSPCASQRVGVEGLAALDPELGALFVKLFDQKAVFPVRAFDGDAELLRQIRRAARMVDMAMGQHDLLDLHILFGDGGLNTLDFAAGIDHGGLFGVLAPEHGAVLLEGGDGDDDGFHGHVPVWGRVGWH